MVTQRLIKLFYKTNLMEMILKLKNSNELRIGIRLRFWKSQLQGMKPSDVRPLGGRNKLTNSLD
ncbi:hypothetical protein PR048_012705 [Dryococelus australis]|uniref:Uncharacterized protein n=1 Tax=Dryococelus australis TaxID=614101 RepID=A0ABQ9HQV8_9NEOP|nr:hypothetical protein PR048_012705 [Dryococelus australis]